MKRWYWLLALVLSLMLSMSVIVACGDDDDDDDDNVDDDDFGDDDDNQDDDDNADDDDDDDDTGDDDDVTAAPQIFTPYWDPDPVAYDATEDSYLSTIVFGVCDPDNDLPGGGIYVYVTGTTTLIWANAMEWSNFSGLPDVSDCSAPTEVGAGTLFGDLDADPWGNVDLCTDMEVSDGAGNFSNLEENFCVVVP